MHLCACIPHVCTYRAGAGGVMAKWETLAGRGPGKPGLVTGCVGACTTLHPRGFPLEAASPWGQDLKSESGIRIQSQVLGWLVKSFHSAHLGARSPRCRRCRQRWQGIESSAAGHGTDAGRGRTSSGGAVCAHRPGLCCNGRAQQCQGSEALEWRSAPSKAGRRQRTPCFSHPSASDAWK